MTALRFFETLLNTHSATQQNTLEDRNLSEHTRSELRQGEEISGLIVKRLNITNPENVVARSSASHNDYLITGLPLTSIISKLQFSISAEGRIVRA